MTKPTPESLLAMVHSIGKRQDRMEHDMDALKNRLPIWVTVLFTIMGSMLAGLITKVVG